MINFTYQPLALSFQPLAIFSKLSAKSYQLTAAATEGVA